MELKLGDKVTFTHYLRRLQSGEHREWSNTAMKESQEGYIVGKRTLQNGAWGWRDATYFIGEGYDGPDYEWQPTDKIEYLSAYLISFSLHRKPVYVLPEYITKLYTQTVSTHHFNPDEPHVDTVHTFGSNDGGATWELAKEEKVPCARNAALDEMVELAQEAGDYD